MEEIDGISKEVFEQYEEVRKSGLTNMFSQDTVSALADDWGLDELAETIDKGDYMKILRNYEKAAENGWV